MVSTNQEYWDASLILLQLHEATKSGSLDLLAIAQAKLEGPKKVPIESDHVLGDEAQCFTSAFD